MLDRLDIENVKSFYGRHEIPLAPITLIFGPNSSGKSTILQSLAVLKQTLDQSVIAGDLEQPSLALHGELVDLGSYSTAVTAHDTTSRLFIGARFSEPQSNLPRSAILGDAAQYCGLGFNYSEERHAPVLRRSIVGSYDNRLAFEVRSAKELSGSQRGTPFRLLAESRDSLLRTIDERIANARPVPKKAFQKWRHHVDREFAEGKFPLFAGAGYFPEVPATSRDDESGETDVAADFYGISTDLFGARIRAFRSLFAGLAYLGPLRAAPKRFQVLSSEQYGTVGTTGEHTAYLLARQATLQTDVNSWLERLDIPYRISLNQLGSDVTGVDLGELLVTTLRDCRNELIVTPQDVGFGISQLLPVIVQMLQGSRRTICVEQPEIHVHPGLQAKVGDLLLDAARPGLRNQVIVETHSEHLMLRIQRRVREGHFDWLTPDSVAVIYVSSDDQGASHAQRLRLSDDGYFLDEWPDGFFSERVDELFANPDSS